MTLDCSFQASTGGSASGHASDGKPGPGVMDPGASPGRNTALYIAAVAGLGVAFWWRYARNYGGSSCPRRLSA